MLIVLLDLYRVISLLYNDYIANIIAPQLFSSYIKLLYDMTIVT